MSAGFLKRAFSSLIDVILVFTVVYATFALVGKSMIQNRIADFDEMYGVYLELTDTYNLDYENITEEYNAQKVVAGEDADLLALLATEYEARVQNINDQNVIDLQPYDRFLSVYFFDIMAYHIIGFLLLMAIYTVVLKGKTVGRMIMQLKLEGSVNYASVFFHDVIMKYFFVLVAFFYSPYLALLMMMVFLAIDIIMMSFRKDKATLRDTLLRISVVKSNYWK